MQPWKLHSWLSLAANWLIDGFRPDTNCGHLKWRPVSKSQKQSYGWFSIPLPPCYSIFSFCFFTLFYAVCRFPVASDSSVILGHWLKIIDRTSYLATLITDGFAAKLESLWFLLFLYFPSADTAFYGGRFTCLNQDMSNSREFELIRDHVKYSISGHKFRIFNLRIVFNK